MSRIFKLANGSVPKLVNVLWLSRLQRSNKHDNIICCNTQLLQSFQPGSKTARVDDAPITQLIVLSGQFIQA
eukprot:m.122679 g.122679  ORF g.122679 m.122679 type:complete len:72 (-) comp15656_c0_seq5:844-1059(-)